MTLSNQATSVKQGLGSHFGAVRTGNGYEFTISHNKDEKIFLNLYIKDQSNIRIDISEFRCFGNVYSVNVTPLQSNFQYSYDNGHQSVIDTYATAVVKTEDLDVETVRYKVSNHKFDWEDDTMPEIPMDQLIMYKLHVRGFTKHGSSQVPTRYKGTFRGVIEKIDHIKELGANCVELMPVVEFEQHIMQKYVSYTMKPEDVNEPKINFWGYGSAYYFAPKQDYSSIEDSERELKQLIHRFHQENIAVVLEMNFAKDTNQLLIVQCLRYWVTMYHIDGFHLNSDVVPLDIVINDPVLARTMFFSEGFNTESFGGQPPVHKRLAEYHDEYLVASRKFLKSDEDMVRTMEGLLIKNHKDMASVRYLSNHNGFRLMDMVSYDEKHNEANGEQNKDGTDYNYSWNCGFEGQTKRRKITQLRQRQLRNAIIFTLFHQGIPLIYAGDEFGQSQMGNNNAYCQDNVISWVNWRNKDKHKEMFDFIKEMVHLRCEHKVLHSPKPVRLMDYLSCGYPDVSFHGGQPWRVENTPNSRYLGVLYCGQYAHQQGDDDDSFYFAYNMFWEKKEVGLPALPKNLVWEKIIDTWEDCPVEDKPAVDGTYTVKPRSIAIFKSTKKVAKKEVKKEAQE